MTINLFAKITIVLMFHPVRKGWVSLVIQLKQDLPAGQMQIIFTELKLKSLAGITDFECNESFFLISKLGVATTKLVVQNVGLYLVVQIFNVSFVSEAGIRRDDNTSS
jgi:hypothetical protein